MKQIFFYILIALLAFACEKENTETAESAKVTAESAGDKEELFNSYLDSLYNAMKLEEKGLDFEVFKKGMVGYYNLKKAGKLADKRMLTIFDISAPSTEKRFYVMDLDSQEVTHHTHVSHGQGSGVNIAEEFSDEYGSYQSSIGFYVTGETYKGKHGRSLRLDGVDEGYNISARDRAIVIHGASYANPDLVEKQGRLGRSQGCPALPEALCQDIIDLMKDQTCFFIYYPDAEYDERCLYLNEQTAIQAFYEDIEAGEVTCC